MSSLEDHAVHASRRHAWLALSLVAGLGPITLRRAVTQAFGVLGCLKLSHTGWGEVDGIGSFRGRQIITDLPRALKEADTVLATCDRQNIHVLTPDDAAYPALLRDLDDSPTALYVKGTLEPRDLNAVAIVGSRKCSFYGRDQANRFSSLLAGSGVTVVSGGARGVDSAAHEGALRVPNGRTLAVLGCGVDIVYPPENAELFQRILDKGALVSEFPPGTQPNARHFPKRNRVISALSRGVIVIEADERSGSLITARIAADDHSRPVMALPGRVDNSLSAGPHQLIRDGATLITNLDDILNALGPLPQAAVASPPPRAEPQTPPPTRTSGPQSALPFTLPPPPPSVTPDQQKILAALKEHREAPPDLLIETTQLPPQVVLRELTLLTLKGRIKRLDAQTYALA